MISEIDLAYTAGIIDGEGYIGIVRNKNYHWLVVAVCTTDKIITPWLKNTFGGTFHETSDRRLNHATKRVWRVAGISAERFLLQVFHLLKLKREQARIALYSRSLKRDGHALSDELIKKRESCRKAISHLNQKGRRRSS